MKLGSIRRFALNLRDDSGGDGLRESERRTDCQNPIADPRLFRIAQFDKRQIAPRINFQNRQIGQLVRAAYPDLNPDFIFAYPAYNVRNTEVGGIMGRSQLKRLDANVARRTQNLHRFLGRIDGARFQTDFKLEGSSNYAFNLIMRQADGEYAQRLMAAMRETGIEFRRGSAGGGNQVRQPYLRGVVPADHHLAFPNTEHVHFYGFYIGNFPDLRDDEIDAICGIVNAV